jgi:hypothetical protein
MANAGPGILPHLLSRASCCYLTLLTQVTIHNRHQRLAVLRHHGSNSSPRR